MIVNLVSMIKKTRKSKTAAVKMETFKLESAKTAPVKTETPQPTPVSAKPAAVRNEKPIELSTHQTPTAPKPASTAGISLELVKPGAKHVYVAGSFNEWKPERAPLSATGDGRWVRNLDVKPGRYEYLFVVDGQWLPDPNAKETVQNPFGGWNSVLNVTA